MDRKVRLSNKIYPYFYGISSDLLFFITIDTMFFSIVKKYSDAQINFFIAFAMLSIIVFQHINLKIIKKIGNVKSIKLGMWILLLSAIIITFSNNYILSLIGYGLYEIAYIFKSMEDVLLKRNLIYLNESDKFVSIQSMGATIYSAITLLISLVCGYLFTLNNYLPMYLCIGCCVINIVLSNFLYEVEIDINQNNKTTFKITKVLIYILLAYCIFYSMVGLAQTNGKLFIQKEMLGFLSIQQTSMYLISIIAVSRIIRVTSNLFFPKIYNKLKSKVLYVIIIMFIISHMLFIFGSAFNNMTGIWIMSIGYFIFLAIRDPYQTSIKDILLNNCDKDNQEEAITYLVLSKNLQKLIFSSIITLILLKHDLTIIFYMFLILSIVELFIITKLYKLLKNKS